jgi:hypothetical protein
VNRRPPPGRAHDPCAASRLTPRSRSAPRRGRAPRSAALLRPHPRGHALPASAGVRGRRQRCPPARRRRSLERRPPGYVTPATRQKCAERAALSALGRLPADALGSPNWLPGSPRARPVARAFWRPPRSGTYALRGRRRIPRRVPADPVSVRRLARTVPPPARRPLRPSACFARCALRRTRGGSVRAFGAHFTAPAPAALGAAASRRSSPIWRPRTA